MRFLLLLPLSSIVACTAPALDATNPLTLVVGPDGGSVESDGLKIDVPAGALSAEVTLTAFPKDRVIDGLTTASQTWSFGPEGQTFNAPITVSVAYEGQHDAATVWWTNAGDLTTFSNLKTTSADGWATASVVHFSEGAVSDDTCGTDAHDGDGEHDDDADSGDGDGEHDDDADSGDGDGEHDDDADDGDGDGEHEDDADDGDGETDDDADDGDGDGETGDDGADDGDGDHHDGADDGDGDGDGETGDGGEHGDDAHGSCHHGDNDADDDGGDEADDDGGDGADD